MYKYNRYSILLISFIFIITAFSYPIQAMDNNFEVEISINGNLIDSSVNKVNVYNNLDTLMLPIRNICETMGYGVKWENDSREILITTYTDSILVQVNKNSYINNSDSNLRNSNLLLDNIDGRIYASIDFFEKAFDISIDYHKIDGTVKITYNNKGPKVNEISIMERQLWSNTVQPYLMDDLWTELNAYDSGHMLMVPLHSAFKNDEKVWQQQFSEHFKRFVDSYYNNPSSVVEGKLNRLHYLYLASQFIVLSEKTNNLDLIPEGLVDILNNEVYKLWVKDDAWQWNMKPFEGGIKERLGWKLEKNDVEKSYYLAIIDEELFALAIGADLYYYDTSMNGTKIDINDYKKEMLEYSYLIFKQEGVFRDNGTWMFQPGVWVDHPDYAYAGNTEKSDKIKPLQIEDIASDTSHSHRFPLWIKSLIDLCDKIEDVEKKRYFLKVSDGLEKQFYEYVIVSPSDNFNGYRTMNFMDGSNGIYRWNYPTQGFGNGYGPYELSDTLFLGWWSFLNTSRISKIYYDIAEMFPLDEDVIDVYVGPNTIRERNELVSLPNSYYNGFYELICSLASKN